MFNNIKIKLKYWNQFIPSIKKAKISESFRGIPIIDETKISSNEQEDLKSVCPTQAISTNPLRIDLGRCLLCGDCARKCPSAIKFTNNYRLATTSREALIIDSKTTPESYVKRAIQPNKELAKIFKRSFNLRQISAGGNNADEMELNACGNVNFDMGRYGFNWVASPRHADGIVITGPISKNMAKPLQDCYNATPSPKIIILAGTSVISGGIFSDSKMIDRSFLKDFHVDLYIPGDPVHPLTFINALLDLLDR
ncbi:MAG: hypothetical protein PHY80_04150 [Rickettsiales bacterium]|nr:hypothetical protein [Rickettsiales bacterium]